MRGNKGAICALAIALATWAWPAGQAFAGEEVSSSGMKAGVLTCKTVQGSGVNLLIHSTVDVKCEFKSSAGGSSEHYKGETGIGLGVDINVKRQQTIGYTVLSADFKKGTYQLAGKYGGVEGSATVGAGIGASVLVGGNDRSISLQPIAISTSSGLGVSGGFSYLYLEPDREADK